MTFLKNLWYVLSFVFAFFCTNISIISFILPLDNETITVSGMDIIMVNLLNTDHHYTHFIGLYLTIHKVGVFTYSSFNGSIEFSKFVSLILICSTMYFLYFVEEIFNHYFYLINIPSEHPYYILNRIFIEFVFVCLISHYSFHFVLWYSSFNRNTEVKKYFLNGLSFVYDN